MRTGLRGNGQYKQELLDSIRREFEYRVFTYQEAKSLPEFEHAAFCSLWSDGTLKKYRGGAKSLYKVSAKESNHRRGRLGNFSTTFVECTGVKKLLTESEPTGIVAPVIGVVQELTIRAGKVMENEKGDPQTGFKQQGAPNFTSPFDLLGEEGGISNA